MQRVTSPKTHAVYIIYNHLMGMIDNLCKPSLAVNNWIIYYTADKPLLVATIAHSNSGKDAGVIYTVPICIIDSMHNIIIMS